MRLSQWAEEHFYLSAESSYAESRWQAYPFQVAILDCMSHDDIEEVDFIKSARVGYTKMILACMLYNAEHKRRNQAVWQPTDDDSDDFCKSELDPALRDIPIVQQVLPSFLQRHKDNTLKQKKFLGSVLHLRGGKAAKNYRRLTVDTAILDELDGFDLDIEKEGSPSTLAKKRIEGATFPKFICGSTPKLKGFSLIEARAEQAEKRFLFHVPCPHCNTEHPLRWGGKDKPYGFKWTGRDAESVQHLCESCGAMMSQAEYLGVWKHGRWVAEDGTWIDSECRFHDASGEIIVTPRHIAFHIWTAYSPGVTWAQIVREFFSAQDKAKAGDKSELKTFTNTTLGETWEEEVEKTDANELERRAEAFPLRVVPLGGLVLVAAVDVQDTRFETVVWAIGRGEEMWTVDYMVLEANPADERDWDKLDAYLATRFNLASGGSLAIEGVAIDTGGHFTHQVYNFCRPRFKGEQPRQYRGKLYAIRGEVKEGQPIKGRSAMQDINWRGKVIKNGVKLWHVGTDTAKDLIHGRLKVTQAGPGHIHFSQDLPTEFYNQLTAEVRMLQKTAHGEKHRWVKIRARNEVLDCTVYSLFVAHALDLHKYTERMWEKLIAAVMPAVNDLFMEPAEARAPPPIASLKPKAARPTVKKRSKFASEEWVERR